MLLALKLKTAIVAAAFAAGPVAVSFWSKDEAKRAIAPPEMVELSPGRLQYWAAGDFTRDGRPAGAPRVTVEIRRPLSIMKHQVSAAEYRACVDDGACLARKGAPAGADLPAVMVNFRDAETYAKWLSRKFGHRYRLPTDAEWTYAAGSRAPDEAPLVNDPDNPAQRWLRQYEREAEADPTDKEVKAVGSFGANERGLVDLAGNVWEWTSSCFTRTALDRAGRPSAQRSENCGVRVVEGRHRAYVTDFIRDARGGGCSQGTPPSYLGFRLVRDRDAEGWLSSLGGWFGRLPADG